MRFFSTRAIAGVVGLAAAALVPIALTATASADPSLQGPAEVRNAGGVAPLESGDSGTPFTLRIPLGSTCGGDANGGYSVYAYMVSAATEPATLTFDSFGPAPFAFGEPQSAVRLPLYDQFGSPYVNAFTANEETPGDGGTIINIPDFSYFVWSPGEIPAGLYNLGIACVLSGNIEEYWNVQKTITANDGDGFANFDWVVGDVQPPENVAPVAVDDAYSTGFETPLTVAAPGVLGNDTDADTGDTLTAGTASDPAGGTVVLAADGSFVYTPDAGFSGDDTFTYVVSDGNGGTDTGQVTVTVAADEPGDEVPAAPAVAPLAGWNAATFTITPGTGGSPATAYEVTLLDGATVVDTAIVPADGDLSVTFGELETGTAYTASVVATNAAGDSTPGTATATPFVPTDTSALELNERACPDGSSITWTVENTLAIPVSFDWSAQTAGTTGSDVVEAGESTEVTTDFEGPNRNTFRVVVDRILQDRDTSLLARFCTPT